jgi:hypothetical protein
MRRLRRAHQRHVRQSRKFRQRAVAAGTAAVITLGTGTALRNALAAPASDPHQVSVSQDADADLLANTEELAIGYQVFNPDQNRNGIPDGAELAKRCAAVLNQLPDCSQAKPDETCKDFALTWGLETCDICGEVVNMGSFSVTNPRLGLTVNFPILATHYLEHGSFSYAGNVHNGRVDIAALARVLELRFPYDPNDHQLAVAGDDLDGDLLTDNEELAAGYNLYDADQDQDLVPDGIELAKQCAEVVDALPIYEPDTPDVNEVHKVNYFQRGIEHCHICGKSLNMGYWMVINPKLGLSIEVPDILCHYMEHGSFSHSGDVHGKGRIDVPLLVKVLQMPRRCGDLGTIYPPGDSNRDCRLNFTDIAELANKWLDSTDPDQDNDAESNKPSLTYQVEECDRGMNQMSPTASATDAKTDEPSFSVRVEEDYIHFEDMVAANCCPDKIELKMTADNNVITIHEIEHLATPCDCVCSFPASAKLGPFDDGTYLLEVYRFTVFEGQPQEPTFIGSTTVNVGSSR